MAGGEQAGAGQGARKPQGLGLVGERTGFKRAKDAAFGRVDARNSKAKAELDAPEDYMLMSGYSPVVAPAQSTVAKAEPAMQQQMISMCQGSSDLMQGLLSILEGFGLLNIQAEGTAMPEDIAALVDQAFKDALASAQADNAGQADSAILKEQPVQVPDEMPAADDADSAQQVRQAMTDLIAEHLKSLENTQNTGRQTIHRAEAAPTAPKEEAPVVAQPMAAPAPVRPMADVQQAAPAEAQQMVADNVASIVESIQTHASQDISQFQVQLKPEHLGRLSVKLTMDAEGIHAQIKAADPAVKGLLQNELAILQDALRDRGLNVRTVEVTYEAATFNFQDQQGRGSQFNSPSRQRHYTAPPAESYDTLMATLAPAELLSQNSSVEFRA